MLINFRFVKTKSNLLRITDRYAITTRMDKLTELSQRIFDIVNYIHVPNVQVTCAKPALLAVYPC